MGFDDFWLNAFFSLAPTVLVGGIFWLIMRAIVRADRNERAAFARFEAEERSERTRRS